MLWVLNLDAEDELAGRSVSGAARRAIERAAARWAIFLAPGDRVLGEGVRAAESEAGRAWCPTPRALAALRAAGARVPEAPSAQVLRRVNERGFAHALGPILPGTRVCTTLAEVQAALASGPSIVKRGLACAGRGQQESPPPAWMAAALREGPLYVEPRVEIVLELGLHGWIEPGAPVQRGQLTVQQIERGRWTGSRLAQADELSADELSALTQTFLRVGDALIEAGYFGPFGIDAFRYQDARGEHFHPLGEINARYSMGWPVGMGPPR